LSARLTPHLAPMVIENVGVSYTYGRCLNGSESSRGRASGLRWPRLCKVAGVAALNVIRPNGPRSVNWVTFLVTATWSLIKTGHYDIYLHCEVSGRWGFSSTVSARASGPLPPGATHGDDVGWSGRARFRGSRSGCPPTGWVARAAA